MTTLSRWEWDDGLRGDQKVKILSLLVVLIALLGVVIGALAHEALSPSTGTSGASGSAASPMLKEQANAQGVAFAASGSTAEVTELTVTQAAKLPGTDEPIGDRAASIVLIAALLMVGAGYALRRRLAW